MTQGLLAHFGLVRPFRFERTLVLLGALVLALVVGAAAIFLASRGVVSDGTSRGLSWGTPRGWYFVYLSGLLILALLLARWPGTATAVLSLAAIEIGLGFGAAALYIAHLTLANTLFPENYIRPRYQWHPLLQAIPVPTPPEHVKSAAVFINSQSMRGPERTPASLAGKKVIALFGGSTTLDFGNRDGESWGDRLQQALGERYAVINHGAPGYTTSEHVIQTAFYQDSFGAAPTCAIYYVGWNDLSNAHVTSLDPGYANYHMPGQIDFLEARRLNQPFVSISPVLKLVSRFVVLAADTARPAGKPPGRDASGPDPKLDEIYERNIRTISSINRQRGVTTVWVGQVMNRERIASETMRGWLVYVRPQDMLPLFAHFNGLLQRAARELGDVYVGLPMEEFHDADFVDEGHFSPAGARTFSSKLIAPLSASCGR